MIGPARVVEVDDVGVLVAKPVMAVRVSVRLRPLPALVGVLVVLVVDMQVLMVMGGVVVFKVTRVVPRPNGKGGDRRDQREGGEEREGGSEPERGAAPPSERVGD